MKFKFFQSILLHECLKPSFSKRASTYLCLDILLHDIKTDVCEDKIPNILAKLSFFVKFCSWNSDCFLPNFGGIGIISPLHGTTYIGLMSFGSRPSNQYIAKKDWFENGNIIILISHGENIIVDDNITRIDFFAIKIQYHFANRS